MRLGEEGHARICTVAIVLVVVFSGIVTGVAVISAAPADGAGLATGTANETLSDDWRSEETFLPIRQTGSHAIDTVSGEDIGIRHDPNSASWFADVDTSAEALMLATTGPGESFAFGGSLDRVLVVRDVETDRTIVLVPDSQKHEIVAAELELHEPEGTVSSEESFAVELANGSEMSINVSVRGELSIFEPDPSPFGQYRIELREGYQPGDSVSQTELVDATEPRLIGIGYNGTIVQNSTTGQIRISVPRHEDIDESWYIEYWVLNETASEPSITKEVTNDAGDNRLTVEIDGSTLPNGSYFHGFTIRQNEEGTADERILGILAGNKLAVGPQSPNGPDVTGDGNPAQDPDGDGLYEDVNGDGDVTPGDATVLFNAVFESNPAVTQNVESFDFNGDGSVTPGDATVLFNEIF